MSVPDVLAFADRKVDGAYPVTEPSGRTVATIHVSFWSGTSFEAFGADGEPLCSGNRAGIWSSTFDAVDPRGSALVSVRNSFWGHTRTVTLPDGRQLTLEGRLFTRDWALRDAGGGAVLSSTPSSSSWSFSPDAWVVQSHDASLGLAEVVAIVALNRIIVKAARAAASS